MLKGYKGNFCLIIFQAFKSFFLTNQNQILRLKMQGKKSPLPSFSTLHQTRPTYRRADWGDWRLISTNAKQSEVKKLLGVSKEVYNLLKKRIDFAQDLIKLN